MLNSLNKPIFFAKVAPPACDLAVPHFVPPVADPVHGRRGCRCRHADAHHLVGLVAQRALAFLLDVALQDPVQRYGLRDVPPLLDVGGEEARNLLPQAVNVDLAFGAPLRM